jgi:tRNA (guanine37-N1)-methyltransferase
MKINVLTLFPEMFSAVTESSILGRAQDREILDINLINIRDFSKDKHNKADDTPFGGGPGMVMMAQPIFDALKNIDAGDKRIMYMSPRGRNIDMDLIKELSEEDEIILLCGHYEGVDQRVLDFWNMEEVSIGDYILTGGELPAMVLIDAVARFIPDVLGSQESIADESIYSGLLECDQYTKPRNFEGMDVPEVLLSGNHKMIHLWQYENALRLTKERRPDLFLTYLEKEKELSKDEKKILEKVVSKPL